MKIRIVDYVGNLGGGVRYTVEILRQLVAAHPEAVFELVTAGRALEHYRGLFSGAGPAPQIVELPAAGPLPGRLRNSCIGGAMGLAAHWNYQVSAEAVAECDVAWVPWVHRHVMPEFTAPVVVGTVVDVIALRYKLLAPRVVPQERTLLQRWVDSDARLAAISHATADDAAKMFDVSPDRFDVIRLSGQPACGPGELRAQWTWAERPFLLYPANLSVHKNHEMLFRAFADWGQKIPLVLTGAGTGKLSRAACDLRGYSRRARSLRRAARRAGLRIGETLLPIGYVTDAEYYALLQRAWALITPTLAEGAGLPVIEAIQSGVPVICGDIPSHREYVRELGAEAVWIDPNNISSLVDALTAMQRNYSAARELAVSQAGRLQARTWADVARDYAQLLLA